MHAFKILPIPAASHVVVLLCNVLRCLSVMLMHYSLCADDPVLV